MPNRIAQPLATIATAAAAVAEQQTVDFAGGDAALLDVQIDSRTVTPGSLYVAIRGANADGHNFVAAAIEAGAAGVAVEEPPVDDIPHVLVEDTREALGWMAAAVHGYPARGLGVIGITGTNGKTTVAHMLAAIAKSPARSMAVIGTVSANLDGIDNDDLSPRTTPEASDLHRMLRRLADGGRITDVAIEVSSHAMAMGRVNAIDFDLVAFTNLSQDHLDFHLTMEAYYSAKARLFDERWAPRGVIWIDDPWGRRLATEASIPITTVGTDPTADVVVAYGRDTMAGSTFTLSTTDRALEVKTSLPGRFNVANAAIALTCGQIQGFDLGDAAKRLEAMNSIAGRYNTLAAEHDRWVVIDYAHTPDAISSVIEQSRALAAGKIIVVAGAGGDRDREKRPLMGKAMAAADLSIVTNDNPRSEDPREILAAVLSGVPEGSNVVVEADRRLAIRAALSAAVAGDVVLVLGKGHESTQEFADHIVPFDDNKVVREELEQATEVRR